jgi:cob(I)alamin adenosyltransferase
MYHLMAELAATDSRVDKFRTISPEHVDSLEAQIEAFGAQVDMPQAFVIPGDTHSSAAFHLARTTVRRAEREVANLAEHDGLSNPSILPYLNRLSSLCFVLSLYEEKSAGVDSPSTTKPEER